MKNSGRDTSEIKNENQEIKKNKITKYLEQNNIRFERIISLMITIITVSTGVVSCNVDVEKAKLEKLEIQNRNREKQPFFSIGQEYSQERKKYIYKISNTGGEIRYSNLSITPILFILQYGEDGMEKNKECIPLLGLYQYETLDKVDANELIAFSDKWIDTTLVQDIPIRINDSDTILLNDYFMHICGKNNSTEKEGYVTSELVYKINVSYYDFQNIEKNENIWCGRSSDLSGKTEGNNILFIQPSLEQWYMESINDEKKFNIDSMNWTLENTVRKCEDYIEKLIVDWEE